MKIKLSIAAILASQSMLVAGGDIAVTEEAPKEIETFLFIKEVNGYIRAGYQNTDIAGDADYTDTALGGKLHIQTASWNGISAGASFYTTNVIGNDEGNGVPFFDANNGSYSILGEAYVSGEWGNTLIKIGRQEIDTPFVDTDDIGMIPNTFEAAVLVNKDIKDTTIILTQVQKMAGVDAPSPSEFTKLNGNDGVQALGVTYEGIEGMSLSGWYYNANDVVKVPYIEATYEMTFNGMTLGLGGQYANMDWEGDTAAKVVGVAISAGYGGFAVGAAYNKSADGQADNLFGGGPFFTSSEHLTIAEAGPDGEAVMLSAEWDATDAGIEGLGFGIGHLTLEDVSGAEATELDITANYAFNDTLGVDVIYSDIDEFGNEATNLRVFVNYRF